MTTEQKLKKTRDLIDALLAGKIIELTTSDNVWRFTADDGDDCEWKLSDFLREGRARVLPPDYEKQDAEDEAYKAKHPRDELCFVSIFDENFDFKRYNLVSSKRTCGNCQWKNTICRYDDDQKEGDEDGCVEHQFPDKEPKKKKTTKRK